MGYLWGKQVGLTDWSVGWTGKTWHGERTAEAMDVVAVVGELGVVSGVDGRVGVAREVSGGGGAGRGKRVLGSGGRGSIGRGFEAVDSRILTEKTCLRWLFLVLQESAVVNVVWGGSSEGWSLA